VWCRGTEKVQGYKDTGVEPGYRVAEVVQGYSGRGIVQVTMGNE
jgi:hypothetical protein